MPRPVPPRADVSADADALLPHERINDPDSPIRKTLRRAAAEALRTLRRQRLPNARIRELVAAIRPVCGVIAMMETWPTAGDERKLLEGISEAAAWLSQALDGLSPRARGAVSAHLMRADSPVSPSQVADDLLAVAFAAGHAAHDAPEQSRRSSHKGLIAAVHRVVEPLGITVSASDGSRFHTIAKAVYVLAGITETVEKATQGSRLPKPTDPKGAILSYRSYQESPTGE